MCHSPTVYLILLFAIHIHELCRFSLCLLISLSLSLFLTQSDWVSVSLSLSRHTIPLHSDSWVREWWQTSAFADDWSKPEQLWHDWFTETRTLAAALLRSSRWDRGQQFLLPSRMQNELNDKMLVMVKNVSPLVFHSLPFDQSGTTNCAMKNVRR